MELQSFAKVPLIYYLIVLAERLVEITMMLEKKIRSPFISAVVFVLRYSRISQRIIAISILVLMMPVMSLLAYVVNTELCSTADLMVLVSGIC